jgi:uncharacterized membrane protein YqjE
MTFLDFYIVDITILLIIFLTMGIIYTIINNIDPEEDDIGTFAKIFVSFVIGIIVSIMYSYITLEQDVLLKENFWD